jgi:hypothetical protein
MIIERRDEPENERESIRVNGESHSNDRDQSKKR